MTHPSSSPVSPNSFPSSTTSRGYDENNFQFQTKAWPASSSNSARKLAGSNGGPLSIETNSQSQPSWKAGEGMQPVVASSPLPPRSTSKHFQASPGRPAPPKSFVREIASVANAKDPRQALAPVNKSIMPENEQGDTWQQPQRTTSVSSLGRRSVNSATLRSRDPPSDSHSSIASAGEAWTPELDDMEQALFEQRLTEDIYGVAVRKINHNGKSNLRYVKCCSVDAAELEMDANGFSSNRSISSHSRSRFARFRDRSVERTESLLKGKMVKVLTWGKKKEVKLPLERFVCVRRGKTTERTRRNICPASRILSLITDDPYCPSLDIEAPTRLDRDKFAKAFSRFLSVPLEGDDVGSIRSDVTPLSSKDPLKSASSLQAAPLNRATHVETMSAGNSHATNLSQGRRIPLPVATGDNSSIARPPVPPKMYSSAPGHQGLDIDVSANTMDVPDPQMASLPSTYDSKEVRNFASSKEVPTAQALPTSPGINVEQKEEDASVVSSITGAGFDQEIVEELHMALTTLRAELEESRAEAARAVKVAEQAIQSAENNSSKDWNSTVTHKAAEAAALAQKRSAEAMAKARMAEERLEQERKKASIWKKQAETATEEAGHWKTRAVVAEVQRAAMAEALEGERKTGKISNLGTSESEIDRLRSKLAMETSMRRKLLNEVQDLRGMIRVYCRPRKPSGTSIISMPSQEILMLHREKASFQAETSTPLSFEFDGILGTEATQDEVYEEMEAVCLSALDGYNACLMTFGQSNSGKTYTMLGKVRYENDSDVYIEDYGIQLQAAQQLFSIMERRRDQYKETVTLSIVEVSNERLIDLLVGTEIGDAVGRLETVRKSTGGRRRCGSSHDGNSASQSEKPTRLEIKTNRDGQTTVHGLVSAEASSFDDVLSIWTQSLKARKQRLAEQSVDFEEYEANSHIICTLKIQSTNTSSGLTTLGKVQFVDLAGSDLVPRRSSGKKGSTPDSVLAGISIGPEWKFANRSIATFSEVITARSQFHRSVPYRNATITHLLSDSLEADTKVVVVACVSSDLKDLHESVGTLKFAQTVRKVVIGKATRHVNIHTQL